MLTRLCISLTLLSMVVSGIALFTWSGCAVYQEIRGEDPHKQGNENNHKIIVEPSIAASQFIALKVIADWADIRQGSGVQFPILSTMAKDTELIELFSLGKWKKVWIGHQKLSGWLQKEQVQRLARPSIHSVYSVPLSQLQAMEVIRKAKLYGDSTLSSPVIYALLQGEKVYLIRGKTLDNIIWFQVWVDSQKQIGWILGAYADVKIDE